MRSNKSFPSSNNVLPAAGMRLLRLAGLSALLGILAGAEARVYAQELAAAATTPAVAAQPATEPSVTQSVASSDPAPLPLPNAKKDKKKKKEKAPKLTPLHIEEGTLTVDGWTGKARLNYDIADLKYIYVWAPGIGTIVSSNQKFPLSKEEPGAFSGNTLTLEAAGHVIQIASEKKLLKDKKPQPAYVYLDADYKISSAFPQLGYGNAKDAPYTWPGAKDAPVNKGGNVPPPLPVGMRALVARPTCATTVAASPVPCHASSGTLPSRSYAPSSAPLVPLPASSGSATAVGSDAAAPAQIQ
ncbi:MAG: hypothetical protein NVSMB62_19390 [Acidobacteriaceae bacterium]